MTQPVRIASLEELPPGTGIERAVAGRVIALFNVDGVVHAMDGMCPHAGGPLGDGVLEHGIVTCPWHGWQFDVSTGRNCLNQTLQHPTFPVTIKGTDVYVEIQ